MLELAERMLSVPVGAYLGAGLLVLRIARWPGEWRAAAADGMKYAAAVVVWYVVQLTPLHVWIVMSSEVEAFRDVLDRTGALAREGVPMYALVGPYVLSEIAVGLGVTLGIALTMGVAFLPALMAVHGLLGEVLSMRRMGGWAVAGGFLYAWLVLARLGVDAAMVERDTLAMVFVVFVSMAAGVILVWLNVRLLERFE